MPSPMRSSMGAFLLAAAAMLGSSACTKDTASADSQGTTTTNGTTNGTTSGTTSATESGESGETDGTASTEGETDITTQGDTNTSGSFYAGPDVDYSNVNECDPFGQDCPEGEKCVPYASSGGTWDANKCVMVTGSGSAGDPCTYAGSIEATDDCDPTTLCWDVVDVEGVPTGVCTEFCTGTPDDPLCPEQTSCVIANEGSINLCIESCDPLLQECGPGQGCYWAGDDFVCLFAPEEPLADGEPCGQFNDCAPGSWCVAGGLLASCDGSSCCTALCDTLDPDACPDPELECVLFYEQGMAPAGYETLGACLAPGP